MPRRQRGAEDGGKLAAAQRGGDTQRIVENCLVPGEGGVDHRALALEAAFVDAGAVAGKACAAAAEQGRRDRRSRCGIADAHLAQHHEIGFGRERFVSRRHGVEERGLVHGGLNGEVRRRMIEVERDDAELGARKLRELIDGGAPGGKICHHLRGDLGRIGGDALRGDAVIAGEHQDLDIAEPRWVAALPKRKPFDGRFEAAEAPWRLGELGFASRNRRRRFRVAAGKIETGRTQFVQGSEARHFGVDSNA